MQWRLQDPGPSALPDYTFEINPNEMTSPEPVKQLVMSGRFIDGKVRGFGSRPAHEWTFGGVLHTQEQYDSLQEWVEKTGKIYLTDHLGRTWLVRLKQFDPVRAATRRFPWRHTYTCRAITYRREEASP